MFRTKLAVFHCITLFAFLVCTNMASAGWVRTVFTYPSSQSSSNGPVSDGDWLYWTTTNVGGSSSFTASISFRVEYNGCDESTPGIIKTHSITGLSWDETYEWQGGSPPTQQWNWTGTVGFNSSAYAKHFASSTESSNVTLQTIIVSEVPNSNAVTDSESAYTQVSNGTGSRYRSQDNFSDSGSTELYSLSGTLAQASNSGTTTGAGPYNRGSQVDSLSITITAGADNDHCGDEVSGYGESSVSFQ